MKERLKYLLDVDKSVDDNSNIALYEFGLSKDKHYDVLVVAPGWKPDKIMSEYDVDIVCTAEHSCVSGYEVTGKGFCMAWIQCASGASNLIDELSTCALLDFDKLIFVGSVGSLVPEIGLGEICTPDWCISGNLANGYLIEDITKYIPFQKVFPNNEAFIYKVIEISKLLGINIRKEPVFCTDSIFCEYAHLDFIKSFGVSVIEMETSSFYMLADMMEKPAVALLAVSDNSSTGDQLLGRTDEQKQKYNDSRKKLIPKIILEIAKMKL